MNTYSKNTYVFIFEIEMLLQNLFHPIVSLYIVMQLLWDYSFGDIDPCTHSLSLLLCKSRDIHNKQGSYGNKIHITQKVLLKICKNLRRPKL